MVRVCSNLAVPDRCKDGARPDSSKILCTGMDDILPQDVKDLEEVRARIKESYNFAIMKYKRAFPSVRAFAETYFDYKRDILLLLGEQVVCVCGWQCREPMPSYEARKIRHVAFQYEPILKESAFHQNDKIANTSKLARLLCTFYKVKHLTIVIENHRSDDHENGIAESQRDSELVFFEPVDIGEALRMLRSPVTKRSDLYGVLIPEHSLRNKLDFDKKLLYDLRSEDDAKGLRWKMPRLSWIFGSAILAFGISLHVRRGYISNGIDFFQVVDLLSGPINETIFLIINMIVTLLNESMGYVHSQRSGGLCNGRGDSSSTQTSAFFQTRRVQSLTHILVQAGLATWSLIVTKIPTWSSSPLDATFTCLEVSTANPLAMSQRRCMKSAHDRNTTSDPCFPKQKQGSLLTVHNDVKWVLGLMWAIVPLGLCWFGVVLHLGYPHTLAQCSWNLLSSGADFLCGIFAMWTNGTSYQVRLATILMVSALQAPITIGLHCAELLCNLSRDERILRQATSSKGTNPRYNSISAALKSWEMILLFVFKAFIHWMFGLSVNSHMTPALMMFTIQIFYCTVCALLLAFFATYISLRRPSGPLPATYGHLQTIADLVDEWQGDSLMFWEHKVDGSNGEPNFAGMGSDPMREIKMNELYGCVEQSE
ncbi:hypothetical protein BPAE_0007g01330 [Botrytis paeoniae]|uniref:Uncharacterized protein n=1 Tax=Botrytis paeoniae TaxID=278948 RepID=A0A4Z1G7Z6_9HELO|nr:hypothetical protein BPAE_0007g01330 [Botrytis paeoniae]